MDLQRLQVVITAKTQPVIKAMNDIVNKMNSVNKSTLNVENTFKELGNVGKNSFKEIIKSADEYNRILDKLSTKAAKYDAVGYPDNGQEPWEASKEVLKGTLADMKLELENFRNELNESLSSGTADISAQLLSNIGDYEHAIIQLEAVLEEIGNWRNGADSIPLTTGLVDLLEQAHLAHNELTELTNDISRYQSIISKTSINGEEYQFFNAFNDKYGSIDNAKAKMEELIKVYSATCRQIENMRLKIEQMAPATSKFAGIVEKLKGVGAVVATATVGIVKLTKNLGKMMWEMEPIHKFLGKLQSSLHSLWVRVKRVLVYSTIVSFFRAVKNQISGFLKQNNELMASLGKAKGAWITAFMPIYNFVIPKIISLINWLTELGAKVAMLTARIFGGSLKASKAQAKALQDEANAASGAAKAYEAQLAAFDELNILEEDKGGGGGSADDLGAPDFDFDEGKMKDYLTWYDWLYDKASKVVDIFKKLDVWLQKCAVSMNELARKTLQMFRGDNQQMADAMLEKFREIGTTLADALNNFISAVNWNKIGQALGAGLDLALQSLRSFIYKFNWKNLGQAIADGLNGMIWQIDWDNVGALLVSAWNIVWQTLAGFTKKLDYVEIGRGIANALMSAIRNIDIKSFGTTIANLVKGLAKALVAFVKTFNMFEFASTLFRKIMDAISEINWLELARDIIAGLAAGLWGGVQLVVGAIVGVCQGLIDAFKKFFGISSPSKVMEEQGNFLIQGLMNGIRNTWNTLLQWLTSAFEYMKNMFSQLWTNIQTTASTIWNTIKTNVVNAATGLKDGVTNAFTTLKSGLGNILNGVKDLFSNAWTTIVDNTKEKFSTLLSNISSSANSIGDKVSNMLTNIANGISSAWSSIKNFVSNALSQLGSISIPHFASGGVISKPTVGLVGEYAGASHNPEIITPENMLRGIMAESNDDLVDTFIQVGRQIVQAIQENSTEIRIGDDVISAAAARGDRDFKKRTGRSQFAM